MTPRNLSKSMLSPRHQAASGWTKPIVLFIILATVVGGYVAYKYGNPYYKAHQAKEIIDEVAQRTYSRRSERQRWYVVEASIQNTLKKRLVKTLDIAPELLSITVRKRKKKIYIKVEWTMVVVFDLFDTKDHMDFKVERWARTE